jgi:hypothetical protein
MVGHALITDPLRFMLDRCGSYLPAKLGRRGVIGAGNIHSDMPLTTDVYFFAFTTDHKKSSYSFISVYAYKTATVTPSEDRTLQELHDVGIGGWDLEHIIYDFPFPIFDRWDMVTKFKSPLPEGPAELYHFLRFANMAEGIKLLGFFDKSASKYSNPGEAIQHTPLTRQGVLHGIQEQTFQIVPETGYREIMHALMKLLNFR